MTFALPPPSRTGRRRPRGPHDRADTKVKRHVGAASSREPPVSDGFNYQPEPADHTRSSGNGRIIAIAVVVTVLTVVALTQLVGGHNPAARALAEKHTITGTLSAPGMCVGGTDIGGYNIASADVEVRDESDKIIGAATTSACDDNVAAGATSTVTFTVKEVVKANFYQLTIATHGGPSYSYAEMKAQGWAVDLTLGG